MRRQNNLTSEPATPLGKVTDALLERARQLAARPYTLVVKPDVTTKGDPVFIAYHPELEFVVAQGDTTDEAITALAETRLEIIVHLLESGLPVPPPQNQSARELLGIIGQLQALPDAIKPTPGEIEQEIRRYWAEKHEHDTRWGYHDQNA